MNKSFKIVMIGVCLTLVGCQSTGKGADTGNPETIGVETPEVTKILEVAEEPEVFEVTATPEIQTDNSEQDENTQWSDFFNCNYSPTIQIAGDNRDTQMIKDNPTILLPKSELVATIGRTNGSLNHFIDIPENEVMKMIQIMEESKILPENDVKPLSDCGSGFADLWMMLRTQDNKSIMLVLQTDDYMGEGIVRVSWEYENTSLHNPDGGSADGNHLIKSLNLFNMIRELAGYKKIDSDLLKKDVKMTASRAAITGLLTFVEPELSPSSNNIDNKEIEVDAEIVTLILSGLKQESGGRTWEYIAVPLKIICEDGEEIEACFFLGEIAIGSSSYMIEHELNNQLLEYFGSQGMLDNYEEYLF